MSSDLDTSCSFGTPTNDQDIILAEDLDVKKIGSLFRDLLQRGSKGELLPSELASQIFSLVQSRAAAASAKDSYPVSSAGDTPGLEEMGWILWRTVDNLAREDPSHHDVLIAFINAFFPLLQTQPWFFWGCSIRETNFLLGPQFRESFQGASELAQLPPDVPGATEEEKRVRSWCNYCRFVARMTRDTEQDFFLYMLWFARDALEDCSCALVTTLMQPFLPLRE